MPEIFDEKEMAVTRTFITVPPAARPSYTPQRHAQAGTATANEAKAHRPEVRLRHSRLVQRRRPGFRGAEADRPGERGRRPFRRCSKELPFGIGREPASRMCQ